MTGLLITPYSIGQASYDLRRLRLEGLIARQPHSNTYTLTPDGLDFAIFYSKVQTDSPPRCWPPTNHRHHYRCGRRYAPSTSTSTTNSPEHAYPPLDKTWLNRQNPRNQANAGSSNSRNGQMRSVY